MKTRWLHILLIIFLTIFFIEWTDRYLLGGIYALATFSIYVLVSFFIAEYLRMRVLTHQCDPVKFGEKTRKRKSNLSPQSTYQTILDMDLSTSLSVRGKYAEALDIMERLNVKHFGTSKSARLVYFNNLISLYDLTHQHDKAEALYQKEIIGYAPHQKTISIALKILKSERLFCQNQFDESKAILEPLLHGRISPIQNMIIRYNLASIYEKQGLLTEAKAMYGSVGHAGKEIAIAEISKEKALIL